MTNQTVRVLELLKRFNNGQKVCIASLQYDILWEGKSEKTIRRDLDVIREAFPDSFSLVQGEKGCYKAVTKAAFENFLSQDIITLMAKALSIAQHSNIFNGLNIDEDDRKILEKQIKEYQKVYEIKSKPFEEQVQNPELFKKLERAIKYKQKLKVTYEVNPHQIQYYEMKPYKILFMQENFYLAGEVENKPYCFTPLRVSKIKAVEIKSETFYHHKTVDNFIKDMQTPLALYSEAYKENLIDVIVEVDRKKAQHFRLKKHLLSQEILEEKKNGNLLLSFKVTQYKEIEELIKRWIPHIKVLEPKRLKKKIEKDIQKYLSS